MTGMGNALTACSLPTKAFMLVCCQGHKAGMLF